MLVKLKNWGLKTIILAKKELDFDLATRYIKTHKMIVESKKDQAINFERLA
jgi:hypothetical protein